MFPLRCVSTRAFDWMAGLRPHSYPALFVSLPTADCELITRRKLSFGCHGFHFPPVPCFFFSVLHTIAFLRRPSSLIPFTHVSSRVPPFHLIPSSRSFLTFVLLVFLFLIFGDRVKSSEDILVSPLFLMVHTWGGLSFKIRCFTIVFPVVAFLAVFLSEFLTLSPFIKLNLMSVIFRSDIVTVVVSDRVV